MRALKRPPTRGRSGPAAHLAPVQPRRTADTLKRLNETEKLLKQRVEAAYVDLELAAKAKDEGNEAFKAQK